MVEIFPGDNPKGMKDSLATSFQSVTAAGRPRAAAETDFNQITSFDNLAACWFKARRSKSNSLRIRRFAEDPLRYLLIIQQKLRNREYAFGPYKQFVVHEKKWRDVVDAPMKDRIVHWMLYEYLLPIWERRFIRHTYGNLRGRGTHAAVQQLARYCRHPEAGWVLQLDISKYFYSARHDLLKQRVMRYIGDHDIRCLLGSLVDSFHTDDRYDHLFDPESRFVTTKDKGMPIGNLTSQLFANIYLSDFDHWVKDVLGVKKYIRYVDDVVVVANTKQELHVALGEMIARLHNIDGLTVHPRKTRIAPIKDGVPYLGYIVWHRHISAGRHVRKRYHKRLRLQDSGVDCEEALQSYRAMLKHTGPTRN